MRIQDFIVLEWRYGRRFALRQIDHEPGDDDDYDSDIDDGHFTHKEMQWSA
jgi:hypothetical protein